MIYNQIIDPKNINIKKKLKYSEHCTLIPIKYNNDDLIIQTPKMYIPFGEKFVYNNKNKKYVDISFLNIENDNNIKIFYDNLNIIFDKINNFYKYDVDNIIKKYNKNDLLRLKITKNILIYNQKRENIDKIINNTYGSFIIHLYGLWLMNDTLYFHWELLQCKLDIPIYLSEYSFIDDVKPIFNKGGKGKGKCVPPPPPPPPLKIESKYDKMIKMGIPKDAVLQKMRLEETPRVINPLDLQNVKLKKTIIKEKQKDKIDDMPYLAELLKRIKLFSNV